jgi:hypothetical protein
VVEVEDVVRVVTVLQRTEPGQLRRAVRPPDTRLPVICEGIDVDAAGKRFDRRPVSPCRGHARLVLGRVGPPGGGHELDERVALAERGVLGTDLGDRAAVCLQARGGQERRIGVAARPQPS